MIGTPVQFIPEAGNKIVIDYLSTEGTVANSATSFTPSAAVTVNSTDYTLTTVTESNSAGGAYKESIESIRQNAPIAFTSQRRLVTAEDYKAQILANYGAYLDDVTSYGGNDNVPAIYGRTYVGLKFKDNITYDTIGAYEDTQGDKIYWMVANNYSYHLILEYDLKTGAISTVFRDCGDTESSVFNLRSEFLINDINKIGEVLYWTSRQY